MPWRQAAQRVEQALAWILMAGLTAWFVYCVWAAIQPEPPGIPPPQY